MTFFVTNTILNVNIVFTTSKAHSWPEARQLKLFSCAKIGSRDLAVENWKTPKTQPRHKIAHVTDPLYVCMYVYTVNLCSATLKVITVRMCRWGVCSAQKESFQLRQKDEYGSECSHNDTGRGFSVDDPTTAKLRDSQVTVCRWRRLRLSETGWHMVDAPCRQLNTTVLRFGLWDGTETSSTLYRWSSAVRAVVPSELMWLSGVFCTRSETVELSV